MHCGRSPELAPAHRIVARNLWPQVAVALDPSEKLIVILELALHQPLNVYGPADTVPVKHALQHLEVVDELVFELGVKLDLVHRHISKDAVKNLVVHGPRAQLFDLCDVQIKCVIHPVQQFLARVIRWVRGHRAP